MFNPASNTTPYIEVMNWVIFGAVVLASSALAINASPDESESQPGECNLNTVHTVNIVPLLLLIFTTPFPTNT